MGAPAMEFKKHRFALPTKKSKLPMAWYDGSAQLSPLRDLVLMRRRWNTMRLVRGVWRIKDPKERRRTMETAFDPDVAEATFSTVIAVGPKVRTLRPGMRVICGDNRQADGVLVGGVVWNLSTDDTGGVFDFFMHEGQVHAVDERAGDPEVDAMYVREPHEQ